MHSSIKFLLVLLALGSGLQARAQQSVLIGSSYTTPTGEVVAVNDTGDPATHAASLDFAGVGTSGSAAARSAYGVLKARSDASAAFPVSGFSYARARFQDDLTINLAGHEGETGYVDLLVYYNWAHAVAGNASSFSRVALDFNGAAGAAFEEHVVDAAYPPNNSDTFDVSGFNDRPLLLNVPGAFAVRADFRFGVAFSLGMQLETQTSAYGNLGVSTASVFADKSAYWGGLGNVYDEQRQQLQDFTVVSASGTDYRQSFLPPLVNDPAAVPEPASLLLTTAGCAAIALVRRRRDSGGFTGPRGQTWPRPVRSAVHGRDC